MSQPNRKTTDATARWGEGSMLPAYWLVCAAIVGQPAPSPPPGFELGQPLNFLYTAPAQSGKKNPSPEQPPPEEKPAKDTAQEQPSTLFAEYSAARPWYSIHGQSTFIYQGNFPFHDPYDGPNSAVGRRMNAQTATGTLYFDVRPWEHGEIIIDPEFSGGAGLNGTLGFAGFPNGEATRTGKLEPTPYLARALYRHTFDLDGEWERVEDAANQIPGVRQRNRFQISIGKMSAEDVLDDNLYSHDPRTQFLNWSLMYTGAWDYPANSRGYTFGALFDYSTMFFAVRYGIFAEPTRANDPEFDPQFLKAHGQILEFQENFILQDHPARIREWMYLNTAHMGKYRDALAAMPVNPDITLTRAERNKYGFGLSFEQEITETLGFLLRAGWNDGQSETWAFTEIDATAAAGFLLKGKAWGRPDDEVGLAGVVNGLSNAHKDYLAAGGIGFIIGDGRLNYSPEEIAEAYYNWQARKGINLRLDVQGVNNPAYNQDRGPVIVAGLAVHLEF
jgi:high affinity Mn2+ porin